MMRTFKLFGSSIGVSTTSIVELVKMSVRIRLSKVLFALIFFQNELLFACGYAAESLDFKLGDCDVLDLLLDGVPCGFLPYTAVSALSCYFSGLTSLTGVSSRMQNLRIFQSL